MSAELWDGVASSAANKIGNIDFIELVSSKLSQESQRDEGRPLGSGEEPVPTDVPEDLVKAILKAREL